MKPKNRLSSGALPLHRRPRPRSRRLLPAPVLIDTHGHILAEGTIGETHSQVFRRALAVARTDALRMKLITALSNDSQHKFVLAGSDGIPLLNKLRRPIVVGRIEAGRIADESGQRSDEFRGMPLQTQHFSRN